MPHPHTAAPIFSPLDRVVKSQDDASQSSPSPLQAQRPQHLPKGPPSPSLSTGPAFTPTTASLPPPSTGTQKTQDLAHEGATQILISGSTGGSSSHSGSNPHFSPGASITTAGTVTLDSSFPPLLNNLSEGEKIIELSPNGRYAKLNSVLGKGAYKVVYKAIDREDGYEIAWNCFQTSRAEFNELSQEIEILKRVRHPNIINFHDCWYNNVEFVFVTELMTSGTLREYIRKLQSPNMKIIKRWSRQILKGLLYLHSHNPPIIHRDIKCDNIFINGAHGEVKIGDMGTAKMKLGKKYTVIGTPEFMAPEMYEEKGYNEKVDVYAFGMCLLEMVTGQYPYSECTNAAQIYKKVSQGSKPDCFSKVTDPDILDLINRCICPETDRWSVQQVLEHLFLTVEPEVILLGADETRRDLTLQVVFKGMDKLSVKFEFNTERDTAEDVVSEMIEENVLSQKYQTLITHDINRILRDLNKLSANEPDDDGKQTWRRTDAFKNELERARQELLMAHERAVEAEKKAELSEVRARLAEEKTRHSDAPSSVQQTSQAQVPMQIPPSTVQTTQNESVLTSSSSMATIDAKGASIEKPEDTPQPYSTKEYKDEQPIEDLVKDTAMANNRDLDKAEEWLQRLKAQDIMTVGDLRDLHDEDWASLGLTVFASRALRNALHGKGGRTISPKTQSLSAVATPPASAIAGVGSAEPQGSARQSIDAGVPLPPPQTQ